MASQLKEKRPMELGFAFFARHAEVAENGLFSVLGGGIDFAKGPMFPAPLSIFLAAQVISGPEHFGSTHKFLVEVFGPDNRKIYKDTEMSFDPPAHPRKSDGKNWTMLLVHFVNLVFPGPGDYIFRLSVDGQRLGETEFEIVLEGSST